MNKKFIILFVVVLVAIVVALVVLDYRSTRPDKRGGNPYAISVEMLTEVDPELITYSEVKQILTHADNPQAIGYHDGKIYLLADNKLQVLDANGRLLAGKPFSDEPRCITIPAPDSLIIGFDNYICITDGSGEVLQTSVHESDSSIFTSVAVGGRTIYVADAGKQRVLLFDRNAVKTGQFEGESGSSSLHGFIVPSPYFDLAVSPQNELWVVNPGMLALQSYNDRGSLMNHWEKASAKIDGFAGCCNPSHVAFLPNGNFVTSEKGSVRIKVYDASGTFVAVVAPPDRFTAEGRAPDIAVDENGQILALDYDKKMIRIFKPK